MRIKSLSEIQGRCRHVGQETGKILCCKLYDEIIKGLYFLLLPFRQ